MVFQDHFGIFLQFFQFNFNNMILKIVIASKLRPKSERVSARKTKRVADDLWLSLENRKFGKTDFGQKVILKNSYSEN